MGASSAYEDLLGRVVEVWSLTKIGALLLWDQRTLMPPGGAAARAEQSSVVTRVAHEKFVSDEIGRLLEELRPYEDALEYDSDEASLVRWVRREYEKLRRVPPELHAEMTRAASQAYPVWDRARQNDDFGSFLPHLRRNVGDGRAAGRAELHEGERGSRHDVAVAREVRGEERRLPAVAPRPVRERDQREPTRSYGCVAHGVLRDGWEAGDELVPVARRVRDVLPRVRVGRRVPQLDRQPALVAGRVAAVVRSDADRERPAAEGIVGGRRQPFRYMVTTQAPPRPRLCWSATRAPSTCRRSAWPLSCHTSSAHCARPVAPSG